MAARIVLPAGEQRGKSDVRTPGAAVLTAAAPAAPQPAEQAHRPSGLYAWYVVVVLTLAQALSFVDRQVLALLVEPIKHDLHISDTLIGLLYGLTFALFYVAVALPIAWLADRSNRRNIIAASVAFWSVMTTLCGVASTFPQLAAARLGVGAGEAGLSPAAQSILADSFPRERLGAALGLFSTGVSLGGGLALIVGGALYAAAPNIGRTLFPFWPHMAPWRVVMMAVGAPGLLMALLFITVREPPRHGGQAQPMPFAEALAHVRAHRRAYLGVFGALSLMIFVSNSASAWIPAFLERRFGWSAPQVGARLGPMVLVCGAAGAFAGGWIAVGLRRLGLAQANLWSSLGGFLIAAPLAVIYPLSGRADLALGLIGAMTFAQGLTFGGGYAALQEMTPPRLRARVTAINGLAVNLIGAGLGPLAVALVTDRVLRDTQSIHLAMSWVAAGAAPVVIAAFTLALGGHAAASQAVAAAGATADPLD
jgi:MFS family permease